MRQFELDLRPPPVAVPRGRRTRVADGACRSRVHLVTAPGGRDRVPLAGWLPALVAQARPGRWITWIAPPLVPTPAFCRRHRLPPTVHRLVFPGRGRHVEQALLERALAAGNSALLLAWPGPGADLDLQALERLARRHDARLWLFCTPPPA
ncbi:MAG: hypothetical protein D6721_03130 [Gammaproteobacteria bacterium]|nr:MAG: hypothetical protein D6721_03130 [Gammaproteobacteria bacterium]